MKIAVWVVGRIYDNTWDLQGVFTAKKKAISACRDETYFIGSVPIDEHLPHDTIKWPGMEFPLKKDI